MPRPLDQRSLNRRAGRTLTALLGIPTLLLGSLTAAAATPPTAAPVVQAMTVSGHHDEMNCDPIRFLTSTTAAASTAHTAPAFPTHIDLPANFQPEGIAIKGTTAYFGSRLDGDIYAADLRTGKGRVISQGPGTPSLGLKIDNHGRLFVSGGSGGDGRVIDTRTGKLLAGYKFTTDTTTFVNDVILTKNAAWFTDSRRPVLYKLSGRGKVTTLPLSGDYVHDPVNLNANGISLTPDGRALIIVQSSTGFLFRVDPRTGVTSKVDLGGAVMTAGDGLLRSNDTLYVVQNRLNKIAVLDLTRDGRSGRLVREITSTDFDVPTTAAFFGNRIYLPNARFTTPPTPTTPYWATAVPR
jgi:sugar lactone lactonase YvrE